MVTESKEDVLIKDIYEFKGFLARLSDEQFDRYIGDGSSGFFQRASSLIKDEKALNDILESPTKEAMLLCINTYIEGILGGARAKKTGIKAETDFLRTMRAINKEMTTNKKPESIKPKIARELIEELRMLYK